MSEFIIRLGISVKICKVYEELVCLTICDNEHTDEYKKNIDLLKKLIEVETNSYDKLDYDDIVRYFSNIDTTDVDNLDSVKSRYYSKLKERKDLIEDDKFSLYPFTLNTAISGKILLDSLIKLEKQFLDNDNDMIRNDTFFDLYSYHKAHKFTLISSNDFLERLAIDFDYNIMDIPNINFDVIKRNFDCGKNFSKYLNELLYLMAIETIYNILYNENKDTYDIYTNMLYMSELDVIINYLDNNYIKKLNEYYNNIDANKYSNDKYIKKLIKNGYRNN